MKDKPIKKKSKLSNILRNVWFWILISLASLVILFFIMLPFGIDYGIKQYLIDQGADQVSLEKLGFNPLTGRMTVKNLTVTVGAQTALMIPEAVFKIQWTPFVRKRFVLQRFTISDTTLVIEELEEGNWQIGGLIIPKHKDASGSAAWHFSFQEATAENCNIKFISEQLKSDLVIQQAKITKLTSWMPEDSARLEFIGQLNKARIQLQLDVAPFGSEIMAAGQVNIKGLNLAPFNRLLEPHLKTLEGRLDADLTIDTRRSPNNSISHFQKGLLNLSQARIQIGHTEISNDKFAWDGSVRFDLPKSGDAINIVADGLLNGARFGMHDRNANLQVQQSTFSWKGKVNYGQSASAINLDLNGEMTLEDSNVIQSNLDLDQEKLNWKGKVELSSNAKIDEQRIVADGELTGGQLLAKLLDQKLDLEHAGLNWKGRLGLGPVNKPESIAAEGNLTLMGLKAGLTQNDLDLLDAEKIDIENIKIASLQNINVSKVILNSLVLTATPKASTASSTHKPFFSTQKTTVQNIQLTAHDDLSIDIIRLKNTKSFLLRNQQGKLSAIDALNSIQNQILSSNQKNRSSTKPKAARDAAAKTTGPKFGFRIGRLEITGQNQLQIEDESVAPPFRMDLQVLEAHLTDLDSRQPDKPAALKLKISDGKNARLSLDGTMQPFTERLNLDWIGKIEALELHPLSPYVIQNTGYGFTSGEMQADLPLKIKQNKLDGAIDLTLYNPTVKPVKSEEQPQEQGKIQLNMPLDSALKLLRDKQNNVKLNIPVSGDIRDPKFSVADAVNKVLAQTLQASALTYVKFMLGPYGIGISLAQMAINNATEIRLNPIMFEPGSAEFDEATVDYLSRVAAILKEHPAVQVSVCGVATESDRSTLSDSSSPQAEAQLQTQNQKSESNKKNPSLTPSATPASTDGMLLALAKKRSERIQNQLVTEHGITAKRVIACKPKIAEDADAKPRVDLAL